VQESGGMEPERNEPSCLPRALENPLPTFPRKSRHGVTCGFYSKAKTIISTLVHVRLRVVIAGTCLRLAKNSSSSNRVERNDGRR